MKMLLWLGILLSINVSTAAEAVAQAADATANTSIFAIEMDAIAQKCKVSEQSVKLQDCMQQNSPLLKAAKNMDDSLAMLSTATKKQIIGSCDFKLPTDDLKALIKKQKQCVAHGLSELKATQSASTRMKPSVSNAEVAIPPPAPPAPAAPPAPPPAPAPVPTEVSPTLPSAGSVPAPASAPAQADGEHVGGSVYFTPSTCVTDTQGPDNGAALMHPELIGVRRELLAPKEASDVYGHRLGKRYIIYQVRISDYSKDYQYVIHDISLNLKEVLTRKLTDAQINAAKKLPPSAYLASSRDLDLLRGIPEKGQDYDPRNLTLHILTGVGSVAGGVSGLTAFSDVMGSAVSVFNGAFLQAFVGILPDHNGTQLNRLSDQAFASNTLVDKLHTKVYAIFVPQALVFDEAHQKTFWKSPRTLLDEYPLDQVDVCVDGSLVTEVSISANPAFSVTDTNVAPGTAVAITDSDTNAAIYFTDVDGTTPTASTTDKYTSPIALPKTIGTTITLRAIAVSPNKQQSSITSHTYVIQLVPTAAPAPATAASAPVNVTLTPVATADTLYYTLDGTTPTSASTKYTASINIPSSQTLKVIEVPTTGSSGPVATFNYKLK